MQILKIDAGYVVEMKKPHPCGGKIFTIVRAGSDVRIRCQGCGREAVLNRLKLERAVKRVISTGNADAD